MPNSNYRNLTTEQLAWLAGMLQGESNYTSDDRVRSTGEDPLYQPPPPCPLVKIEMIEKDVMEVIGEYVGEKVKLQKRLTTADKKVYRVSVASRSKVEALLRAVLPYSVGEVTINQITNLLALCDEYNAWLADGGRSKHSAAAARAGQAKRRAIKEQKLKQLAEEAQSIESAETGSTIEPSETGSFDEN